MTSTGLRERLAETKVLPVIVLEAESTAVPVAEALAVGRIAVAEVTMRTPAALGAIRAIAQSGTGVIVGAGTVLSPGDVDRAAEAGAQFLVSPGLSERVVDRAREFGLPIVPGVATASEVQRALELGLSLLKFFPAEASGGAAALSALRGPFPEVEFVPTGGVNLRNAPDYLAAGNVLAVGGTWIVPQERVGVGDYEAVERLAHDAHAALG